MSWKLYRFGDFLTRSKIPIEIQEDAEYKRVTIKIKHNGVSVRDFEKGKAIGTKKQFILKGGQFVLSKIDARYGAFGIAPNEVDGAIITGNFWAYDVDFEKVNIEWFNQFTNSQFFYDLCERASSGITHRKYLSENSFLNNEIYLPEINEQLKIIEEFKGNKTSINVLSSELTHQLVLEKQLRNAFLREAMQGKLTEAWRASHPELVSGSNSASQLFARIKTEKAKSGKKNNPLPPIKPEEIPFEIPESWVWCRLGDITTLITDGKHGDSHNQKDSGYYFLSAKDLQNNQFIYDDARQITFDDFYETHRRTNLEPGDLCVVNTGATIGKTVIAPDSPKTLKTTFQKSVAVVKFIRPYISVHLMEFLVTLQTPTLLKTSRGSAINNLLLGDMRNMIIPLPPLSEQLRIVSKLDELMQYCDQLKESIKTSQRQNEMLLQQVLREALEPKENVMS